MSLDDTPDQNDLDLIVESSDNVIASVGTNGGFAFARSGDVVVVTGPDGAKIIHDPEGNISPSTPQTPTPDEPADPGDDGGNNDMDFAS